MKHQKGSQFCFFFSFFCFQYRSRQLYVVAVAAPVHRVAAMVVMVAAVTVVVQRVTVTESFHGMRMPHDVLLSEIFCSGKIDDGHHATDFWRMIDVDYLSTQNGVVVGMADKHASCGGDSFFCLCYDATAC
jgi:hypothetical protein